VSRGKRLSEEGGRKREDLEEKEEYGGCRSGKERTML
jgi:hypothetical protein